MASPENRDKTSAAGPAPAAKRRLGALARIGRAWDWVERGPLLIIATLMFLAATSIMLAEAFSRAFLDRSYFWAEEAVRFLIVWAFFLSLGAAGRGGYHIRTDLVVAVLSRRMKIVCGCLAALVGLAFSAILFDGSVQQVLRYHAMGMLSQSNLELPMWLVFLAMPIGAVLFAIYYLRLLVHGLTGNDPFAFAADDVTDEAAGTEPAGKF